MSGIACIATFACVGADETRTSSPPESQPAAAGDTLHPDYRGELAPEFRFATRDSLIRKFGPPDSIRSEAIPNRHMSGITDTIFTVFYRDLVATVHKPGGGSDMFSGAWIAHNRYLRTPMIGMAAADVERLYGRPESRTDSSIAYACMGSCTAVEDPVEFVLAGNRVQRVRLSYYVD